MTTSTVSTESEGGPSRDVVFDYMVQTPTTKSLACSLTQLEHLFPAQKTNKSIVDWFKRNKDRFALIQDNNGDVKLVCARILGLRVCIRYIKNRCPRGKACPDLHLCRNHVGGFCMNGLNCRLDHSLQQPRCKEILGKHGLLEYADDEVLRLVRCSMLEVCGEYNAQGGVCPHGDSCRRIHVCSNYVMGRCELLRECAKSHSLVNEHSARLLESYNLTELDHQDLLNQLLIAKRRTHNRGRREADDFVLRGFLAELRRIAPDVAYNDDDDDEPLLTPSTHIHQADDVTTICADNLQGRCGKGEGCPDHHCLEPVVWQVKFYREWMSFDARQSQLIEKALSDTLPGNVNVKMPSAAVPKEPDTAVDVVQRIAHLTLFGEEQEFPIRRLSVRVTSQGVKKTSETPATTSAAEPAAVDEEDDDPLQQAMACGVWPGKLHRNFVDVIGAVEDKNQWQFLLYDDWIPFDPDESVKLERSRRARGGADRIVPVRVFDGEAEISVDTAALTATAKLFDEEMALLVRRGDMIGPITTGELTTPGPGELTTPGPGELTTPGPVELTTPGPGELTTPRPGELTPPRPNELTPPRPRELTPPRPRELTTPGGKNVWYWRCGGGDEWRAFSEADQTVIETAYNAGQEQVNIREVYVVNFPQLHQINQKTKRRREVVRRPATGLM